MLKKILFTGVFLSSLLLPACGERPGAVSNVPEPADAVVNWLIPGKSLITHGWKWTPQPDPNAELQQNLGSFKTPGDVEQLFIKQYRWVDDYDTSEFLSPNQFTDRKKGVCTAFARYWQYALAKQGHPSVFVAFWSPQFAHAICVYRGTGTDGSKGWYLASNGDLYNYPAGNLNPENPGFDGMSTAIINSAKFFVGENWQYIQTFDENGKIMQEWRNAKTTSNKPLAPSTSGRNIFSLRWEPNQPKPDHEVTYR